MYLILETFGTPTVVTDEDGETLYFNNTYSARQFAEDNCQEPIVVKISKEQDSDEKLEESLKRLIIKNGFHKTILTIASICAEKAEEQPQAVNGWNSKQHALESAADHFEY